MNEDIRRSYADGENRNGFTRLDGAIATGDPSAIFYIRVFLQYTRNITVIMLVS